MANTKSAIKRIRRIKRQTEVNKTRKSRYKIALKKMKKLIDSKKKKEALSYLPKLNSELMKIAKTGVIKKGNACLLYTSPSPRDPKTSRMPSSA